MKKALFILATFIALTFSVKAQTQPTLPPGSQIYSSNLFLAPDSTVWTGKGGLYINLGSKRIFDRLLVGKVDTLTLQSYYTKTQVDAFLSLYYDKTQVDSISNLRYTKTEADLLLGTKIDTNKLEKSNGIPLMDANKKIKIENIPDQLIGAVNYMGAWSPATNTPPLPAVPGPETKGHYYVATDSAEFGGEIYRLNDWIISSGTEWQKIEATNTVRRVNGKSGIVEINKADVGLGNVDNTSDANKPISTATQTALGGKEDVSNKATSFVVLNNTLYPTTQAVANNFVNNFGNQTGIAGNKTWTGNASFITSNTVSFENTIGGELLTLRKGGLRRWAWYVQGVESGGNLGSNLDLYKYTDAGVVNGQAMSISRATGAISLPNLSGTGNGIVGVNSSGQLTRTNVSDFGYVPYTGATQGVDLNTQDLEINGIFTKNPNTLEQNILSSLPNGYVEVINPAALILPNNAGAGDIIVRLPRIGANLGWSVDISLSTLQYPIVRLSVTSYDLSNGAVAVVLHNVSNNAASNITEVLYGRSSSGDQNIIIIKRENTTNLQHGRVKIDKVTYSVGSANPNLSDRNNYSIEYELEENVTDFVLHQTRTNAQFTRDSYYLDYNNLTNKPNLSGYVPYTGATSAVNLNAQNLTNVGTFRAAVTQIPTNTVEVAEKNRSYYLITHTDGRPVAKWETEMWTGTAFAATNSWGFGTQALQNNTGINSNGFGYQVLQNNTGVYTNGFGQQALQNNTGVYAAAFGHQALINNTGDNSNGFGRNALAENTGNNSNGFGYQVLRYNNGSYNNAFGYNVLHDDPGATFRNSITAIGYNIPWSAITKNNQTVFSGYEIIGLDLTNARINSAAGNALVTKDWVTAQNYLTKNKYLDIVQVTANRNLLATDAGKNLIIEASATITVQNSTSQAFAVGDVVDIRVALGSTLTIAASTGVTIYYDGGTLSGSGSFDITGFKRVRIVCEAENVFSIG